jgi:hypothetical protein
VRTRSADAIGRQERDAQVDPSGVLWPKNASNAVWKTAQTTLAAASHRRACAQGPLRSHAQWTTTSASRNNCCSSPSMQSDLNHFPPRFATLQRDWPLHLANQ